jgi:g-D-glutamyl-meso-diaminopimelate peptidase
VGEAPLSEPESQILYESTQALDPALVIAWHTQGQEIYWQFLDLQPQGAEQLGQEMAAASGYRLEQVPYASGFAGYKDWFIQDFDRPGYTVEAGAGENPLPLQQLPEILQDNLPIFLLGLTGPTETVVPAGGRGPERNGIQPTWG